MNRMGLIDRIFKNSPPVKEEKKAGPATQSSTQFYEDDPDSGDTQTGRNAPRRELVQVILRDTMRKLGIPSDWIECRILSAVTRAGRRGLHVNFVVKQAHERLLPYVFPFQDSFEKELSRFEPRCRDWLLSLGWEFVGFKASDMPDPKSWNPAAVGAATPLQAGVLASVPAAAAAAAAPAEAPVAERKPALAADEDRTDDEVERDLQALFAIRDAALADSRNAPLAPSSPPDFEDTHPGAA